MKIKMNKIEKEAVIRIFSFMSLLSVVFYLGIMLGLGETVVKQYHSNPSLIGLILEIFGLILAGIVGHYYGKMRKKHNKDHLLKLITIILIMFIGGTVIGSIIQFNLSDIEEVVSILIIFAGTCGCFYLFKELEREIMILERKKE